MQVLLEVQVQAHELSLYLSIAYLALLFSAAFADKGDAIDSSRLAHQSQVIISAHSLKTKGLLGGSGCIGNGPTLEQHHYQNPSSFVACISSCSGY